MKDNVNYNIDILDYVYDYVNNEIDYIKREMDVCGNDLYRDLAYLENLTDNDYHVIAKGVLSDDELDQKINETIHYYLYH
jgi:hypothetical protein